MTEQELSNVIWDTKCCWIATRLNGASASMACDGNVNLELLKAFDEIHAEIIKRSGNK